MSSSEPAPPSRSERGGLQNLSGRIVVVADDDPEDLDLLRFIFAECGAMVIVAADADEAVRAVLRQPCDVVVSDVRMPGDGLNVARTASTKRIPAIAITGRKQAYEVSAMLAAGFSRILFKPTDPAALCQAVVDVLQPAA